MKTVFMLALLFLSNSSFAGEIANGSTVYSAPHTVALQNVGTTKECRQAGGKWSKANKMCFADRADSVIFEKSEKDLKVIIATSSTNDGQCQFQSETTSVLADGSIFASSSSSVYDDKGNELPASCDVTIKFNANGTISAVQSPGEYEACHLFCATNASLDIDGAVKVKQAKLD